MVQVVAGTALTGNLDQACVLAHRIDPAKRALCQVAGVVEQCTEATKPPTLRGL